MRATLALRLEAPPPGQARYELPPPPAPAARLPPTWAAGVWPLVLDGAAPCDLTWQVQDDTLTLRAVAPLRQGAEVTSGRCVLVAIAFSEDRVLPDPQLLVVRQEAGPLAVVLTVLTASATLHRLVVFLQPTGDGAITLDVQMDRHLAQPLPGFGHSHLYLLTEEAFVVCDAERAAAVVEWPVAATAVTAVRPLAFDPGLSLATLLPGFRHLFPQAAVPVACDTFGDAGQTFAAVLWASGTVQVYRFHGLRPSTVASFALPKVDPTLADAAVSSGLVHVALEGTGELHLYTCYVYAATPGPRRIHRYALEVTGRGVTVTEDGYFPAPPGHALHRIVHNAAAVPTAVALWYSPSDTYFLQGLDTADSRCWACPEDSPWDVCYSPLAGGMALTSPALLSAIRPAALLDSVERVAAESRLPLPGGLPYFCGGAAEADAGAALTAALLDVLAAFAERYVPQQLQQLLDLQGQSPQGSLVEVLKGLLADLPPAIPAMEEGEAQRCLARLRGAAAPPFAGGPVELVARLAADLLSARSAVVDAVEQFVVQFPQQYHHLDDDATRQFVATLGQWCVDAGPAVSALATACRALEVMAAEGNGARLVHALCDDASPAAPDAESGPPTLAAAEYLTAATYVCQRCWAVQLEERPGRPGYVVRVDALLLLWLAGVLVEGNDYAALERFVDAFQPEEPLLKHFRGFLHLNPEACDAARAVECWRETQAQLHGLRPEEDNKFQLLLASLPDVEAPPEGPYAERYFAALLLYINAGLRASIAAPSIRTQLGGHAPCLAVLLPDAYDHLPLTEARGDALFYQRLHHHGRQQEWAAAYKFIAAQAKPTRRREGTLYLCGQLVERAAFSELVELDYAPDVMAIVLSYLWTKAECTDVHLLVDGDGEGSDLRAGLANYYQLLYAFLFHRYDLPSACHVLYRLAQRHKLESLCRPQDWVARVQCLAACCTTLALLPETLQVFAYDPQKPSPLHGDTRATAAFLPALADPRSDTAVTLPAVRRELLRARVELELCRATAAQWATAAVSPLRTWSRLERVGDLVALLVEHRQFATAISLCLEFQAGQRPSVDVDVPEPYLDQICTALATHCATQQLTQAGGAEGRNTTVAQSWAMLKDFLGRVSHGGKCGLHYYETVLLALLMTAPGMAIPDWVLNPVRFNNPTRLIQLYLAADMTEAAAKVAWEFLAWRFRQPIGDPQPQAPAHAQPGPAPKAADFAEGFAPHATVSNATLDRLHGRLRAAVAGARQAPKHLQYCSRVLQVLDTGLRAA